MLVLCRGLELEQQFIRTERAMREVFYGLALFAGRHGVCHFSSEPLAILSPQMPFLSPLLSLMNWKLRVVNFMRVFGAPLVGTTIGIGPKRRINE